MIKEVGNDLYTGNHFTKTFARPGYESAIYH